MRAILLVISIFLLLPPPASAAPTLNDLEVRLRVLEQREDRQDAENQRTREQAKAAAKSEADGVKDTLSAQVQGLKDNFNLLVGIGGVVVTLLIAFGTLGGLWTSRKARYEAQEEARKGLKEIEKSLVDDAKRDLQTVQQSLEAELKSAADALMTELKSTLDTAKKQADEIDDMWRNMPQSVAAGQQPQLSPELKAEAAELQKTNAPPHALSPRNLLVLAIGELEAGRHTKAARYLQALVEKRPNDAVAWLWLARVRFEQRLFDESLDCAERAIEAARADGDRKTEANAYLWKGDVLCQQGDWIGAGDAYEKGRALWAELVEQQPDNADFCRGLAVAWSDIGDFYLGRGNVAEAWKAFENYRALMAGLVGQQPDNAAFRRNLAVAWGKLGDLCLDRGSVAGAREAFEQCRSLMAGLVERQPVNADFRHNLAVAWCAIGDLRLNQGSVAEAFEAFEEYRSSMAGLMEQQPDNAGFRRDLAVAWSRVGDLHLDQGRVAEAREAYETDRKLMVMLVEQQPDNIDFRRNLTVVLRRCGLVASLEGALVEAKGLLENSQGIMDELIAADPEKPLYLRDKAWLAGVWGDWHNQSGHGDDARRCWRDAVEGFDALELRGTLDWMGRRGLAEYRRKLDGDGAQAAETERVLVEQD
ncbi:MAG: tetratricopeptide repeat protein [Rhodospirillaceae bacterium]|nr:tetratricopeptide repeat protein [Rhodospirillales bacterium]